MRLLQVFQPSGSQPAQLGCTMRVTHRSMEKHLEECSQAHMMLMMRQLNDQQQQIHDLVQAAEVDKETFARARESDRKQLGEMALTVASLRTKLEKQGEMATDIEALQTSIKKLEISMKKK